MRNLYDYLYEEENTEKFQVSRKIFKDYSVMDHPFCNIRPQYLEVYREALKLYEEAGNVGVLRIDNQPISPRDYPDFTHSLVHLAGSKRDLGDFWNIQREILKINPAWIEYCDRNKIPTEFR
jgi:hypothetical protein